MPGGPVLPPGVGAWYLLSSLHQMFLNLIDLSEDPSFGFIDFPYCSSVFNFIAICSRLVAFFPLLPLG